MKSVYAVFIRAGMSAQVSKNYEYLVRPDDEPEVGDFLVTSVANQEEGAYLRIAKVVSVNADASVLATKFYLQLISDQSLGAARKENDELVSLERQRVARERDRQRVLGKLREYAEMKRLVDSLKDNDDPEIKDLLAQLKGD